MLLGKRGHKDDKEDKKCSTNAPVEIDPCSLAIPYI